jgi:hypothetical protein
LRYCSKNPWLPFVSSQLCTLAAGNTHAHTQTHSQENTRTLASSRKLDMNHAVGMLGKIQNNCARLRGPLCLVLRHHCRQENHNEVSSCRPDYRKSEDVSESSQSHNHNGCMPTYHSRMKTLFVICLSRRCVSLPARPAVRC